VTDPEAYVRAVAPTLGLTIAPAHLPGVVANLTLAARMAGIVEAKTLIPADEAAPVFVAAR